MLPGGFSAGDEPDGSGKAIATVLRNARIADAVMNLIQNGIFPSGLTLGVAHGSRLNAEGEVVVDYPGLISISAIKRDSRYKIRSNPSLTAQNNKEAMVSIVHEIPILKSTISSGAGTARDVIQNIERRKKGESEVRPVYTTAGHEVRPWLAEAGSNGLLALIERLKGGEDFDVVYRAADKDLGRAGDNASFPIRGGFWRSARI